MTIIADSWRPHAARPVLADLISRPSTRGRALVLDIALVLTGVVVVALLARVSVPVWPVPITGQTLGVILVGAALGSRRGAASLATYAAAGLAGLPVFASGGGLGYVLVPSFGFVVGFIPAAFVAGWFAEHAWDRKPRLALLGFGAASIVPFLVGVPYMALILSAVLGQTVSFAGVMEAGVLPFILGGVVKAVIAALLIPIAWAGVHALDVRK